MSDGEIKKKDISQFLINDSNQLSPVRTILLFGKNTATYKFALCHSLMKRNPSNSFEYEELRDEFLKALVEHHEKTPHQFVKGDTKLTQAMDDYLKGPKGREEWKQLVKIAENNIYNNVFDAFQNVGSGSLNSEYMLFEHDKKNRKLIVTDRLNEILESNDLKKTILTENEARWRVVEEAWRNDLSPNLILDQDSNIFYRNIENGRVNLRSAVDTLLPYQKGFCFYCGKKINKDSTKQDFDFPDVDHFLPLSILIKSEIYPINPNGVWNLVISCMECNRGPKGKFDQTPSKYFYEKLLIRNCYFVEEHRHSLRFSILASLSTESKEGVKAQMRKIFEKFNMLSSWTPSNFKIL